MEGRSGECQAEADEPRREGRKQKEGEAEKTMRTRDIEVRREDGSRTTGGRWDRQADPADEEVRTRPNSHCGK